MENGTPIEGDLENQNDGATVPIGVPFPNSLVFILDKQLNPVPVGVAGELCVAGDGVAAGYLGDPALTRRKFIQYRFAESTIRLYRTGDLARWDTDGRIHILQRMDHQIKIRGHRVDLYEINSHLNEHPNVEEAAIAVRKHPSGENFLAAWYVSQDGEPISRESLVDFLSFRLPSYMIPEYFTLLDQFPLTASGKLDFKHLPEPVIQTSGELVEPANIYEKALAAMLQTMLGVRQISMADSFFDLGGNSLHLIELLVRIQDHFKIEVAVNALLKAANLQQMARIIEDIVTGKESGAAPYFVYNPNQNRQIHCFPPAGGFSLIYQGLAHQLNDTTFFSYNYLSDQEKTKRYVELIRQVQPKGPYILFGYSMGGNLAFEIGKELENHGESVEHIIIMDAYRISNGYRPSEADLKHFEHELKRHFKAHTGSDRVQEHILKQAHDYIQWCYERGNHQQVDAPVHFIIEENDSDNNREARLHSWRNSSKRGDFLYYGLSRHEDMLAAQYLPGHAKIIADIL